MRTAQLLVNPFVIVLLGVGPQTARAQAAVGYGMAASSSATSSVAVSKVYSAVPKTMGNRKVVVHTTQPAGSGAAANKTSRRNTATRVPTQETQAHAAVTGATARPLGTSEAGLTVVGAEPQKPQ